VILMRFNTSKILIVKSTLLPCRGVYKHSWIYNWIAHNQINYSVIYKITLSHVYGSLTNNNGVLDWMVQFNDAFFYNLS
jgi:hypothetical protein